MSTSAVTLSREENEILSHTFWRAAGGRFCGDSPAMRRLVAAGLMEPLGCVPWCPDEYFVLTKAGIAALNAYEKGGGA